MFIVHISNVAVYDALEVPYVTHGFIMTYTYVKTINIHTLNEYIIIFNYGPIISVHHTSLASMTVPTPTVRACVGT